MKFALSGVAIAGLFAAAGAATAGGFVAPVAEPVIVEPVVIPQVGSWEGGYVGATLGYAFGSKDTFEGWNDAGEYLGDSPSELKIKGANGGLRAGYRWQRGQWVFGPEISIEGGSIKDDTDFTVGFLGGNFDSGTFGLADGSYNIESKARTVGALKAKVGYEVAPNTLITGHVGVVEGRFEYRVTANEPVEIIPGVTTDGFNKKYSRTGVVYGVGVEHKFTDQWSVTGEVERNHFSKKDVTIAGDTTEVKPSFTNVKIGVNYNF